MVQKNKYIKKKKYERNNNTVKQCPQNILHTFRIAIKLLLEKK